jgi:hypothetical protein
VVFMARHSSRKSRRTGGLLPRPRQRRYLAESTE